MLNPRLEPGARFPDVRLTDHAGNERTLTELVAGNPTVLQFYRGWWCPKEQRYLRGLVTVQADRGLLARMPAPAGPVIERYGSAQPWPWDRCSAQSS